MNTLCFLLTLSFSILLIAIKKQQLALLTLSTPTISQLMLIGFFTSAGIIIPGVSKSVILMIFGTYSLYLSAIASLNLTILIPIILGMALGSILFLKLIDFCFQHFKNYTYSTILGFVIGSIFILFV